MKTQEKIFDECRLNEFGSAMAVFSRMDWTPGGRRVLKLIYDPPCVERIGFSELMGQGSAGLVRYGIDFEMFGHSEPMISAIGMARIAELIRAGVLTGTADGFLVYLENLIRGRVELLNAAFAARSERWKPKTHTKEQVAM